MAFAFRLVLLVPLAAAACAPRLGPAPSLAAPQSFASARALTAPEGAWPADDWWRAWGDPALDALMAEALAGSPDVAAAQARIRKADALAEQAGAARLPTLEGQASAALEKQSYNNGIPAQFIPHGFHGYGRAALSGTLDLDLWGKNRAALAAATSEAQAARVDFAQARLTLTTAIADAYAELAQDYADRDVAADALHIRDETGRLTAERVANGLDTRGEQRQADARVPAARADVAALDEAIGLTRNRLAALVGAGPDRGLAIERPPAHAAAGSGLPADAGIALIGRRPDVAAERLRAQAAASRIKAARADFYPNLSLSGLIGVQSLGLSNLVRSGSAIGQIGPALTLPLFDGGARAGRYRGARADYDEAVARYDAALVAALREVADAVTSARALDRRLAEQRASLAAAEDAFRIARLRYQGQLATQLTVLTAEDSVLGARRAVADLEARGLLLDIALVRALGGGYRQE